MNNSGLFVVNKTLIPYILKSVHVLFMKPRLGRSSLWLMKCRYVGCLGISSEDSLDSEMEKGAEWGEASSVGGGRTGKGCSSWFQSLEQRRSILWSIPMIWYDMIWYELWSSGGQERLSIRFLSVVTNIYSIISEYLTMIFANFEFVWI
jgi:hypothetical protein